MSKIYLGIDPGISGAIAIISETGKQAVFDFEDEAVIQKLKDVDIQSWMIKATALVELVHAHPKQGVKSTFAFGKNFGQWIGRLEALSIPFNFIDPRRWQNVMFGSTPKQYMVRKGKKVMDTKSMSLTTARQMFPAMSARLMRKKDNGRADALLIAEYCRWTDLGMI